MRVCPKCGAYYADGSSGFCLVDGTPLVNIDPHSDHWSEGARALKEKDDGLRKQKRKLKWRRVLISTMLVATIVVCAAAFNRWTYVERVPRPTPTPTPSPSPSPSPTPTPSPSPSPTPSPSPSPSAPVVYRISGQVMDAHEPLIGITIRLGGTKTDSITTNADGRYTFSKLPAEGNYTITPVGGRRSFTPPSIPFNKLRQDGTADFIVRKELDPRYKISGRVLDAKGPLGGVKVVLDGTKSASTTTDANGNYGFSELAAGGSYTITPVARAPMSFTPSSRSFTNLTHDGSADFVGVVKSDVHYKISGRVMDARQSLGGVTIKLEGSKLTSTTTDANGSYIFTDLRAGGAYTITPVARAPMSFTPSSRSFTNLTRDESADFSGRGQDDRKLCTDADRARERETFLERYAATWERSIRSEEPKIIAATVRENLPAGVEPNAVEATARLSPIKYEVSFLECTPRLVTARYEWQVRMFLNGTTKTVVVRKRKTCGKVVGVWLCR